MLHVIPGEWKIIHRDCAPNTNMCLDHQIQDMKNEIYPYCHEKKFVYINFHCRQNKIIFSCLTFSSTIFVFMKYSHAEMSPSK